MDDLDDVLWDGDGLGRPQGPLQQREIEDENSNGNREVYINRELIFSKQYINAIKYLGENRYCSKNILDAARAMLEHHHGDKYEDLYFVDSVTNKVLCRTDYRVREQEVVPTAAMKEMARNSSNIISIHNHPTDALPSVRDLVTCHNLGYRYGLVVCHGGGIFQYKAIHEINTPTYESECIIYYKAEREIADEFERGRLTKDQFATRHQVNFTRLSGDLVGAGAIIKEVLWNGKPQKY